MAITITQKRSKLIKNITLCTIVLFISAFSCNRQQEKGQPSFIFPSGKKLSLRLALEPHEQQRGLSGIAAKDFSPDEGMLFYYRQDGPRSFWMPDTYFDLDIIFLDKNFEILAIERDVPHHPGRDEPPEIYRTKSYYSRHVLEIRSDSWASQEIKVGLKLKWSGLTYPSQIK